MKTITSGGGSFGGGGSCGGWCLDKWANTIRQPITNTLQNLVLLPIIVRGIADLSYHNGIFSSTTTTTSKLVQFNHHSWIIWMSKYDKIPMFWMC